MRAEDTGAQGNKTVGTRRSSKVRDASTFLADSVCRDRKNNQAHQFYSLVSQKVVFIQRVTALALMIGSVFLLVFNIFHYDTTRKQHLEATFNV